MSKKETAKRYCLFILSLFIMGIGIALTKHGDLGVSPGSSIINVLSIKFEFLSFGTWLIIFNFFLVFLQILVLRRKFKLFQFLQIPLVILLGYFTDLGMLFVDLIPNDIYIVRLLLVICGVIVVGFSVSLGVIADVFLSSGEAFVKALADVTKKDFANLKIIVDITWVVLSILLSLIFFDGKIMGTREGTVISAVFLGTTVKLFMILLKKPLNKILTK